MGLPRSAITCAPIQRRALYDQLALHSSFHSDHDYLAIQATSTESERTFSMADNTITDKRLDPETVRASLCLKSWPKKRRQIFH